VKNADGLEYEIHYAALFSKKKDAVPIILSHGWPGCYLEFMPMLEFAQSKYAEDELP
jgi:microsomal epoxide hydrolase